MAFLTSPVETMDTGSASGSPEHLRGVCLMRRLAAEGLGTALLPVSVIGSGIMGVNLADGNMALVLLAKAIATGRMLYVITTVQGPMSGAHFNPAVSLAFALRGQLCQPDLGGYVVAQVFGAVTGVWVAHLMLHLPILQVSKTMHRTGRPQWVSEGIATFGLLFVIFGGPHARADAVPMMVAVYVTGAYWFTSSTSFANLAVTLARGFSDRFAGIYPGHIPAFIFAQLIMVCIAHVAMKAPLDE